MLKAEPLIGVTRYKWISQRYDNRHLRQPAQEMRRYPGRLSTLGPLWIEVLVVVFGEIVNPAFKQANDSIGGIGCDLYPSGSTAATGRFGRRFRPFLTFHDGQPNFLPVFKPDFRERFKDPIFVEGFDRFCHEKPQQIAY